MRRLLVCLLLMAACGGGDSSRGPIADPAAFLAELPTAECEHLVRCGMYGGVEECVAVRAQRIIEGERYAPRRYDPRIVAAVARGTVVYSAARAGQCLDAIADRSCSFGASDPAAQACREVLVGTVPDGSVPEYAFECVLGRQSSAECQGPACCEAPCEGTLLHESTLGGSCGDSVSICVEGLRCLDGICAEGAPEGGPCARSSDCRPALVCRDGRCASDDDLDDSCNPEGPFGPRCARLGDACGSDGQCHPMRHAGQSCNDTTEWCDVASVCALESGRCIGLAAEGEDCFDRYGGPLCRNGLYCEDGPERAVCRRWLADGEACTSDYPCESQRCDRAAGRCAPLPTCE